MILINGVILRDEGPLHFIIILHDIIQTLSPMIKTKLLNLLILPSQTELHFKKIVFNVKIH